MPLFDLQVANKLFPMASISQQIEDFAIKNLQSVIDDFPAIDCMGADRLNSGLQTVLSSILSKSVSFFIST